MCTVLGEKSLPCEIFYCVRRERLGGSTHLVLVVRVGFPEEEATIANLVIQGEKIESKGKHRYERSMCGWQRGKKREKRGPGGWNWARPEGPHHSRLWMPSKEKIHSLKGKGSKSAKLNIHWVFGPLKTQSQELTEKCTMWTRTRGLLLFNLLIRCK